MPPSGGRIKPRRWMRQARPRKRLRPFHWLLEFPEVFWRRGGRALTPLCNPPFINRQRIPRARLGEYLDYLKDALGSR